MFDIRIRDNQCYCHGTKKLIDCDGYTNVAGCYGGLPFALSFPHYYGAPKLQSSIYGLHADPNQHLSQLYMEPNLGILFEAKIKFQISLMLKDFPSFGQLGGIRDGLLPFFTISMVSILKKKKNNMKLICYSIPKKKIKINRTYEQQAYYMFSLLLDH